MKNILHYIYAFTNLNVDKSKGIAPHKPVLLLSLLDAYAQNLITTNHIYLTPELKRLFDVNWSNLVETNHDARIALPFYHLRNEKIMFWQLQANSGCELWVESKAAMRSISNLNTAVSYALIDEELHQLLLQPESRQVLRIALYEKYFPNKTTIQSTPIDVKSYTEQITCEILEEEAPLYEQKLKQLKASIDKAQYEEEVFVRGALFKRVVPRIYQYTCCITGWNIQSTLDVSMIDACHIKPFSLSFDDTITNGICLCPNLHRAFDRGLIGIDENYKVIVSPLFTENQSPYNLSQWQGTHILLPQNPKYHPNKANFVWHLERIFKK